METVKPLGLDLNYYNSSTTATLVMVVEIRLRLTRNNVFTAIVVSLLTVKYRFRASGYVIL